jgi:hypothetical protein
MERPATVKVWDPVVRLGHWTLVAAFMGSNPARDAEIKPKKRSDAGEEEAFYIFRPKTSSVPF